MTDEQGGLAPREKSADAKKKDGLDGILQAGEKLIEDAKTKPRQIFVVTVVFLLCLIFFVFVIK